MSNGGISSRRRVRVGEVSPRRRKAPALATETSSGSAGGRRSVAGDGGPAPPQSVPDPGAEAGAGERDTGGWAQGGVLGRRLLCQSGGTFRKRSNALRAPVAEPG